MIAEKVREEAAVICAIAASNPGLNQAYGSIVLALRGATRDSPSLRLAIRAWDAVTDRLMTEAWDATVGRPGRCDHPDAEAEALLRSGWSPGDPL